MNLGIVSWMRRVLPRGDIVAVGIGVTVAIDCFYLLIHWWFGAADESAFRTVRFVWLTACAALYGQYRIVVFHPVFNPDYRRWLEMTPWTSQKPLLGGPVQIVAQDLVVICALTLLLRERSLMVLAIPTAFLFGYHLALAVASRIIGHWGLAYLIAAALGLIVLMGQRPEAAFAAADGCFIIGRIAVSFALKSFPWTLPYQADIRSFKAMKDEEKRRRIGWPYDQLAPKDPELIVPLHDGICLSLLVSWWWIVVLIVTPGEGRFLPPLLSMMAVIGFGIVRISQYVISHRSPISFVGRIFTLRWIIPSYDVIAIGPLLALIGNSALQALAIRLLVPQMGMFAVNDPRPGIAVSALGVFLALIAILVVGPGLEKWRLAAKHQIVFDLAASERLGKADQFVEL